MPVTSVWLPIHGSEVPMRSTPCGRWWTLHCCARLMLVFKGQQWLLWLSSWRRALQLRKLMITLASGEALAPQVIPLFQRPSLVHQRDETVGIPLFAASVVVLLLQLAVIFYLSCEDWRTHLYMLVYGLWIYDGLACCLCVTGTIILITCLREASSDYISPSYILGCSIIMYSPI